MSVFLSTLLLALALAPIVAYLLTWFLRGLGVLYGCSKTWDIRLWKDRRDG
jgi:hypothetical protein